MPKATASRARSAAPPVKRRKPAKALENAARQIKDSDEFVMHVANIAERYRREHALDAGSRSRDMRQSLRTFQKHAAALDEWLRSAGRENRSTPEGAALDRIGTALNGAPTFAYARSKDVGEWLEQAARAAAQCLAESSRSGHADQSAPAIAAEALRATFERHQLKLSTKGSDENPADAVRLLCAIAKSAGDADLTPRLARDALTASGRRKSAAT